jgi:Mg/Co/Ni transporter MgtE
VADDGRIVGMLPHAKMLATLTERGPTARVGDAMVTDFESTRSGETLVDAFERMVRRRGSAMPVVDDGVLVGMLTVDAVSELMSIRAAMDAAQLRAAREGGAGDPFAAWPTSPRGSNLPA